MTLPIPDTTLDAFVQAQKLAEKGDHLESALRYLVVAGAIGCSEMEAAGAPADSLKAFEGAVCLVAHQVHRYREEVARRN